MATTIDRPSARETDIPRTPTTITVTDVLMEEVISSAGVPVVQSASYPRPVAVFRNPNKGRTWNARSEQWAAGEHRIEALVLSAPGDTEPKVKHVVRDAKAPCGWTVRDAFTARWKPRELVTIEARATDGRQHIWCVFIDDNDRRLYYSLLATDPRTRKEQWRDPKPVNADVGDLHGLDVSYDDYGQPMAYARVGERTSYLCFAVEPATRDVFNFLVLKGNSRLAMTEERSDDTEKPLPVGLCPSPEGGVSYSAGWDTYTNHLPGKKVRQVVDGVGGYRSARFLVLNEDGTFSNAYVVPTQPSESKLSDASIPKIPGVTFRQAVGRLAPDSTGTGAQDFTDIYAVDEQQRLWVVRQDRQNPWDGDHRRWKAPIPVDRNVGGVSVTRERIDETAIFAWDVGGGNLRLEIQDARTRQWRALPVRQPERTTYTGAVHRIDATVRDQTGVPMPGVEVSLSPAKGAADGEVYWNDPTQQGKPPKMLTVTPGGLTVHADGGGRIALSVRADNPTAPAMMLVAGAASTELKPGKKVLDYLAGNGRLRETDPNGELPKFGVDVLARISSADGEKRQKAADWMTRAAGTGLKPSADQTLAEHEAIPAGLFSWVSDAWRAVENGVCEAVNWVEKQGKVILDGITALGEYVLEGVKLAVEILEDVGRAIYGAVKTFLKEVGRKLLDLLLGGLPWAAIWRTEAAFEQAIGAFETLAKDKVTGFKKTADDWLDARKKDIETQFSAALKQLGTDADKKMDFRGHSGIDQKKAGRLEMPDPTVRYLWDKVSDYVQGGKPPRLVLPADTDLGPFEQAWQDLKRDVDTVLPSLKKAGEALQTALDDVLKDPSRLNQKTLRDVLVAVKSFAVAMLDIAKTLLDVVLNLARAGLDLFTTAVNAKLDLGFFGWVWEWAAEKGGNRNLEPTILRVFCLLAAFPVTLLYKMVEGNGKEPFPNGFPDVTAVAPVGDAVAARELVRSGGILTALIGPTCGIADLRDRSPWFLTTFNVGAAVLAGCCGVAARIVAPQSEENAPLSVAGVPMPLPWALFSTDGFEFVGAVLTAKFWEVAQKVLAIAATVWGAMWIIVFIVEAALGKYKQRHLAALATVTGNLSNVTEFMNLPGLRSNIYVRAGKTGIDVGTLLMAGIITACVPDQFV